MVAAGTTLQGGKYSLDREIGRGGFGITFQATHHYLKHIVVIKTLNEKLRQHPDFPKFERQFQDEARRLATCIHPNIVRISDFFVEAGLPYMVMEYIPGETLGEAYVMAGIPLPETVATHYIRQIAAALEVVHQNGLLHRDIKPDNIILRRGTQEVVLIDFGIAREFNSGARQTHTGLVSEGYSPIEQYLSSAPRSPATDVYGLAATLYTLLTAQVPMPALLRDREKMPSPKELQPQLSAAVNQAVMRGMAVEAKHRPASISEWLKILPPPVPIPEPSRIPTYAVPTINLSEQKAPPIPITPGQIANQTTRPPVNSPNHSQSPPNMNSRGGKKSGWKTGWQKICDRLLRPQVFIATGTAMLAASAGFSVVRMMSPTSTPTNSSNLKPVFEQPTNTSTEAVDNTQTPSAASSTTDENTTPSTTSKTRLRTSTGSTSTNYRSRRRSSNNSSSTTRDRDPGNNYPQGNNSSENSNNQENGRKPNSRENGQASELSGTNSRSTTQPAQPKQSPSPSLVERIRKIRDTRNSTSNPANPKKATPAPNNKKSAGDNQPVVVPVVPERPSSNDVVVPTQEVRSSNDASVREAPTE